MRLKGGDPFVFGRGGEEALVLREAGIPYEVVPGITAGIAAPAYAGIPVTHRELASGVAFVTGHENPAKPETALDWPALAAFPGTLVFYMGVKALPRIASQLIAGGRPASEPVAVVEQGTLPGQKTVAVDAGRDRVRDGYPRSGDHAGRPGRGAALAACLAGDPAAVRPHRGGHAGARASVGAGGAAARTRGDGRRSARHPHPGPAGRAARREYVRPALRHVADRRGPALLPPARRPRIWRA